MLLRQPFLCDNRAPAVPLHPGAWPTLHRRFDISKPSSGAPRRKPSSTPCSIDGCEKPAKARGWCAMHWRRWSLEGTPGEAAPRPKWPNYTVDGAFEAKVDLNGPIPSHKPDLGRCHEWTAARATDGYGLFAWNGRDGRAHRFAYERIYGHIAEGLVIDHLCRNPLCVNPVHLEAVTQRENVRRGVGLAAANMLKTHCASGHPFDAENTYIGVNGGRHCRKCHQRWTREYRDRQKILIEQIDREL